MPTLDMASAFDRLGQRPLLLLGLTATALVAVVLSQGHAQRTTDPDPVPVSGPTTDTEVSDSPNKIVHWMSEGYTQLRGRAFRVRLFGRWLLMVSSTKLLEELRNIPDEILSFREAAFGSLHGDYTMGNWRHESNYMAELVKGRMTRSLGALFPAVYEEVEAGFMEEFTAKLDAHGEEWTPLHVVGPFARVVCRTSNRLFVGLPLCRDPEYMAVNVDYTFDVVRSSNKIKAWPKFLEPITGWWYSPMPHAIGIMRRLVGDAWQYRRQLIQDGVRAEERPNDFLQWNLEVVEPFEQTLDANIDRLLRLNFTAIHTTTSSFTWALYHIASEPEKYLAALREEVEELVAKHGWSKAAVDKMHKMDSFLRESQRVHGVNTASVTRVAMQDYTFSDGSSVARGDWVGIPSRAIHRDPALIDRPDEFDGFRWADADTPDSKRYVAASNDYLPWGIGKHMCPGRFWAANEMKTMLAYVVTHYDVKMENEGVLPQEVWIGYILAPDYSARVMMRRRIVA